MALPLQKIYADNPGAIPTSYTLPPNLDMEFGSSRMRFNGAAASGTFIMVLELLDSAGNLMLQARTDEEFAVGDTGVVSWAPFLRRQRTTAPVIGEQVAYVERTTNITLTGTNEAAPTTILDLGPLVFNGIDRIELTFFSASTVVDIISPSSSAFVMNLWDDATDLGRIAVIQNPLTTAVEFAVPLTMQHTLTPSAGTHTYKIRGWVTTTDIEGRVDAAAPRLPAYLQAVRVA